MLEWRGAILQDKFKADSRRNGAIVVKNNNMQVVRRYNSKAAWPVSWEGPSFNHRPTSWPSRALSWLTMVLKFRSSRSPEREHARHGQQEDHRRAAGASEDS